MILAWTLVVGLASYRAWRILALDSITQPFRDWLMAREARSSGFVGACWTFLTDLITCPWCLGFWHAGVGAWLVADLEDYSPAEFALVWLAASAICGALNAELEKRR